MKKRFATLLAVISVVLIWSCDQFQDDVTPDVGKITKGNADLYTVSNGSAVIDLQSLLKPYADVELKVSAQPGNGTLRHVAGAVFSYKPRKNFNGKDFFLIDLKSNGKTLTDSVTIFVGQDSTDLPCAVYALYDSVSIPSRYYPLQDTIDVLSNDRICGIGADDLELTIYSAAAHGAAAVSPSGDRILYTPEATFSGPDAFIYKISSTADTSVFSLGYVTVFVYDATCTSLRDDHYLLQQTQDNFLHVFLNDQVCNADSLHDTFTIQQPENGTAIVTQLGLIKYSTTTFQSDSLTYKYCQAQNCYTATVRIDFTGICGVVANDDTLMLAAGSVLRDSVNVLHNDTFCSDSPVITLTGQPKSGQGFIRGKHLVYTPNSAAIERDSAVYRVCDQGDCKTAVVLIRRN